MRRAAAGIEDWEELVAVARRHRVEGLVHDGLVRSGVSVPPEAAEPLAAEARRIARENLRFAAESMRIARDLEEAGIRYAFVKGLTLNMLAFGTLAVKKSVDVDIFVDPARYLDATALIKAAAYGCAYPGRGSSDAELLDWAARHKHTVWMRDGITVELHASLVDSPEMLQGVTIASPRQGVDIGPGMRLATLGTDEIFAYLCVHGATHGWSRIKWLADVAALLAGRDAAEVVRLHRRAIDLGAGRATAQALLLCRDLLGLPLDPALERELRGDRAVRQLAAVAVRAMAEGGSRETIETVFGTVAVHLVNLRMMKGWRFKAAELKRKLAGPGETGLAAPLLAVPKWLLRRARGARY